jgi:hypothetical protein
MSEHTSSFRLQNSCTLQKKSKIIWKKLFAVVKVPKKDSSIEIRSIRTISDEVSDYKGGYEWFFNADESFDSK